jgi:hypothetical protein
MTVHRGLDLLNLDVTTEEEKAAFRRDYVRIKGYSLPAFEFWLEFRPDQLKRARLQGANTAPSEYELPHILAFLHLYSIVGFEEGILYEGRFAEQIGATRSEILAAIAVAYIHGGPFGMSHVHLALREFLAGLEDRPATPSVFPAEWGIDPDAFYSGLDFSDPELASGEVSSLRAWYENTLGEVPRNVEFLLTYRPKLLKGYRARFEGAMAKELPKQMMPYMSLIFNVSRGSAPGIRENVQLARSWAMTREQTLDAISWGTIYGGLNALDVADSAAGDLLAAW